MAQIKFTLYHKTNNYFLYQYKLFLYLWSNLKNKKKTSMKKEIIIAAVTTVVILAVAIQINKSRVKKGKQSMFA